MSDWAVPASAMVLLLRARADRVGGPWSGPSSRARAFQTRPLFPQDRRLGGRAGPAAPSVTCQDLPRPTRTHPARRTRGLAMAGTGPRTGYVLVLRLELSDTP